jgi:hypothetical protein
MVIHHCYQMVTIVMGKDVMSLDPVAIEDHYSDWRFDGIIEEPL